MGSSSFLKALAKEKEDKGVDERGARTTSGNESLHYRKAANKSKAGDSSASASASSSGKYYSQGQKAEVIGNTGLRKAATITKTDSKKLSGSDKGVLQKWKEQREQAVRSQEDAKKKGQNAIEALMTASKKQTEEQNKKKSASFTAGLLDSMGGNAAKILTKGIEKAGGTTAGTDYMKAQLNALEETKNANKGYGTAGAIVGEFAKAGAGYATVGKAAEQAALKAAAKVSGGKALGKAGTIATKLAAQQAADTAVNTPITIAAGLAEGKDRKEILKDIGKQEATDAAFNVGLEALGAGAKAVKNGITEAKETRRAMREIPEQIEKSMTGQMPSSNYIKLGKTPKILQKYGMIEGEMLMPQSVVPKIAYPAGYRQALAKGTEMSENQIKKIQGHDLGFEVIRQLPEKMNHPLAILKSNTQKDSLVILTDMIDKYKQPVIVPVKVAKDGTTEIGNIVPSMYGRKGFSSFIDEQEKKGNILFINKKRIRNSSLSNGVQFPEPFNTDADPMLRIAQKGKGVKATGEDVALESMEDVLPGNVTSPSVTSNNATAQSSTLNIKQDSANINGEVMENAAKGATDFVVEDAAQTARAEQIDETAEAMLKKHNTLQKKLSKKEIAALKQERINLDNTDYIFQELEKIKKETNGDTAAVMRASNQFEKRKKEIDEMLAYQEAFKGRSEIKKDTAHEILDTLGIKDKKKWQQVHIAMSKLEKAADEGTLTQEMTDQLFEKVFDISAIGKSDAYKLKQKLRNTTVYVDVSTAADIDIYSWQKKPKGLKKVKYGGVDGNIETLYAELSRDYPTYFPKGIDRTEQMAEQIRTVAEMMQKNGQPDKAQYKTNFDRIIKRFLDDIDVNKAYSEKVIKKIDKRKTNLMGEVDFSKVGTEEVQGWHDELYRLKQNAEKIPDMLNKTENTVLEGMLNGDYTEAQAKKLTGPRYSLVKQKYEAMKPVREMEERISKYKNYTHAKKYNEVAEAVGDIKIGEDGWVDKRVGLQYERETAERNLYDICKNKETADRINDTVYRPIHKNEQSRVLMVNDYSKRVTDIGIDTKARISIVEDIPGLEGKEVSESALVQWLGENEYRMKQIDPLTDEFAELKKQVEYVRSCLDEGQAARIDQGITTLQAIYKEIHAKINEVLIRNGYDPIGYIDGYFPHMNFDDPKGPVEQAMQKLGFNFASKELPMDISGRTETFRPGKKWAGSLLERKGNKTDYDALRAFDIYMENISDVIYHTDDIQRLRAYEEYIRYQTSEAGIKEKIDEIRHNKALTPEERIEEIRKEYENSGGDHKLQNYVNHITEYTNQLAGKKHSADRPMEKLLGRKAYRVITEVENKVSGNMVVGNIGSAMTNIIPITQSLGSASVKNSTRGLKEALEYMGKDGMDELTRKSAFLATRSGTERTYKNWLQNLAEKGGNLNPLNWMEAADTFSTQAVWRARYYDNISKRGMSEAAAIQNADEYARGLFGGRSKGSMPTIFNSKNPLTKPFTMFQLEVNNQLSYIMKDIPREEQGNMQKIFQRWFGMAVGAYVFNDLYEKATGRRSALDPFGIANETIGDITGMRVRNTADIIWDAVHNGNVELTEEADKKTTAQTIANLTENIGEQVPFIGGLVFGGGRVPLSGAVPGMESMQEAVGNIINGKTDDADYRTTGISTALKELSKPLWYLGMPTAGGQLKKTAEGAITMARGGEFGQTTKGEKLKFAVDQESPKDWAQALMFGKWSTDGGRAYIEDNSSALGTSQTKTYRKLITEGVKNIDAFEEINKVRVCEKAEDKRSVILNSSLSDNQKATLYYDLVLDSDSKDREVLDHFEGKDSRGEVAKCLMQMAGQITEKGKKSCLQKADLSEGEKVWIYLNKLVTSDNKDKEQSRVLTLQRAGVTINEYLMIRQSYGTLYNSGYNKDAKQQQLIAQMNELGLSQAQQAKVKELFAFGGGYKDAWKY